MPTCIICLREKPTKKFRETYNPFTDSMEVSPICSQCYCSNLIGNARVKSLKYRFRAYKKTLKCKTCEESRHYLLTFHHLNKNTKENTIIELVKLGSMERLKEELRKCVVLCYNCHNEVHYKEDHPEEFPKEFSDEELLRLNQFYKLTRSSKSYIFMYKEIERNLKC